MTENKDIKAKKDFFKSKVLGHPSGLFVLFFTEMWERFSFYGMRVLLINFLTMTIVGTNPGWQWSAENAGALYGTYAGLLYLSPIIGGMIADKYIGYRWAVVLGALIMTFGHISMAIESEISLYVGLGLLVIGTGFFKPNITSILSEMYKDLPEKKDGAYTIFYMGVNSGAFFGMMLCGYLAERVGWSWGFGLAGIFMLLGALQFWLSGSLFGNIGGKPCKLDENGNTNYNDSVEKRNPFTLIDKILIGITALIGILYLINDPLHRIVEINILPKQFLIDKSILSGDLVITLIGLFLFLFLIISRTIRYEKIVKDRMIAVVIFAFFTIFFWMAFEQGASSLVLFARDFTNRTLSGYQATIFYIVNTLLTVVPLLLLSWVFFLLAKQTHKKILSANIILAICFVGLWGLVSWVLYKDYSQNTYKVSYDSMKEIKLDEKGKIVKDEKNNTVYELKPVVESTIINNNNKIEKIEISIITSDIFQSNQNIFLHQELEGFVELSKKQETRIRNDYKYLGKESQIIKATVIEAEKNQVGITTSWFSILNSFFIISLASLFTRWWDSKYNPSASVKYGLGLIIMSLGFAALAFGARIIPQGAEAGSIRVSMIWLIIAYLFHTMGELCSSPIGLSYISKLVPGRMIAFMFGIWYLAIAIGSKLAGSVGGMSEKISQSHSMSYFFLIFTIIPAIAGVLIIFLNPIIKKLMHGVR